MNINITNLNPNLSKAIQEFLISEGFSYGSGAVVQYTTNKVIGANVAEKDIYNGGTLRPEKTFDASTQFGELVKLVTTFEPTFRSFFCWLNDKYLAEVTKDKVTVGCQTFDANKVLELADKIKELRK